MKKLITALTIIYLNLQLLGQTYYFIHYSAEKGLAHSQVKTVVQDNNGMLWIGTIAGLTRYDGKNFVTFTKKDGLAEDWITTSFKDRDGNLWFGHWGGELSKYTPATGEFTRFNLAQYTYFKSITSITQDSAGNFWFGTVGAGIYLYEPKTEKVYSISASGRFSSENITSICIDKFHKIWFATDNGIVIYNPSISFKLPQAYTVINTANGLNSDKINCISQVLVNEIWIGTADAGIAIIKLTKDITNVSNLREEGLIKIINTSNGLSTNAIQNITEDKERKVWIGTRDRGVCIFTPENLNKINTEFSQGTFQIFTSRQGLNYDNVNCIFNDRDGSHWIATDLGLNQYLGDQFIIYDDYDYLINNLVWAIYEDKEKNLWFGTNKGLSKFTFINKEFQPSSDETIKDSERPSKKRQKSESKKRRKSDSHKEKEKSIIILKGTNFTVQNFLIDDESNTILSIFEHNTFDNRRVIWVGTNNGVFYLKEGKNKFSKLTDDEDLLNTQIFAICSDNENNLWFATKKGAVKYEPEQENFTLYNVLNGLGGNSVFRIFKDSKGNLWFGFLGGYLTKYAGNSFKTFDKQSGIDAKIIFYITEDLDGNLWFATYGHGLYKYDGKTFTNFSVKDGLSTDAPHSLVCDNNNNIWIGTNDGVDKYDRKNNTFIHFGKMEGFLGIETNQNAVCKDYNGNLWFGTIMGAVRVNPQYEKINTVPPITLVNKLSIRHRNVPFPKNNKFSYADNYLTFHYIGVCLTEPQKVLYQCKLEGFDTDWQPITHKNEAIYTNIPAGKFTFMVKACNNDGVWSELTKYSFEIIPPFWQRWWFYATCVVIIASAVFFYIRLRERRLRKQNELLEEQVELRTMEIQRQKEIIEEVNKSLEYKNLQITDSIDYAKRIQEAFLPPTDFLAAYFSESFIFFKPRDIVSGDFYWTHKINNTLLFAVVDCTGHGVPGAFMSLISHNMLDQIVIEHEITETSEILGNLSELLLKKLRQRSEITDVKDSLEIALCSINLQNLQLTYSGTKHPLYLIRNSQLLETRGDKYPIGLEESQGAKYSAHTIQLQKQDNLYLFSDGYIDQKGGPNKKKFMNKPFQQLLLEISSKPAKEQKQEIEKRMNEWMDGTEQIDDMLILGIKI